MSIKTSPLKIYDLNQVKVTITRRSNGESFEIIGKTEDDIYKINRTEPKYIDKE